MNTLYVRDTLKKMSKNISTMSPAELEKMYHDIINTMNVDNTDLSLYRKIMFDTQQIANKFWVDDRKLISHIPIDDAMEKEKAVSFFKNDHLLIFAGAGMSVDSCLKTFETMKGDITYEFEAFNNAIPHSGYKWLKALPKKMFVLTTNIDNMFVRAGFDKQTLYECHGNYADRVCHLCDIMYEQRPDLVTCEKCNTSLTPNFIKLGSLNTIYGNRKENEKNLKNWISESHRFTIIEIGCGVRVPTLRDYSEILLDSNKDNRLIRINPDYCTIDDKYREQTSLLNMGLLDAIKVLGF
jgi:NAD-dependent SIR2 family protein deacetylase